MSEQFWIGYAITGTIALAAMTHGLRDGRGWSIGDVVCVALLGPIAGWVCIAIFGVIACLLSDVFTKPRWFKDTP